VLGFGEDIPAFMLIPARGRRHAAPDLASEEIESP
jgi:hypothetical protein